MAMSVPLGIVSRFCSCWKPRRFLQWRRGKVAAPRHGGGGGRFDDRPPRVRQQQPELLHRPDCQQCPLRPFAWQVAVVACAARLAGGVLPNPAHDELSVEP